MPHIGKYHVVRLIGEGGMGRVYEASDPVINRRVAIKTISERVLNSPETRGRFLREAQAAGQLSHPNLITIHDVGEHDRLPFLVMEYLEGHELSGVIAKGGLSVEEKLRLMIDAGQGLAYAHSKGLVHRDIKPANIFVTTTGQVKILDFGLARGLVSDLTQTGNVVGTPNYMAPEQIRGDQVDQRADIFAAGVVLYELLTGRKPFSADTTAATIYQVLEHEPQSVDRIDPNLPGDLAKIVQRAIEKNPVLRYQRIEEMTADLARIKAGEDSTLILAAAKPAPPAVPSIEVTRVAAAPSADIRPQPSAARASRTWIAGVAAGGIGVVVLLLIGGRVFRPASPAEPVETRSAPVTSAAPAPAASSPATDTAAAPNGAPRSPSAPAAASAAPAPAGAAVTDAARPTPPQPSRSAAGSPADSTRPGTPPAAQTPAPTVAAPLAPPPPQAPPERVVAPEPPPPPAPAPAPAPAVVAAPPPVAAAPPPPPPPPPAPPAPVENPTAAVNELLARYKGALEARDLNALKQIWPGLSGRQEAAIKSEFDNARAIGVTLSAVSPAISTNTATVTCRRDYVVTTNDRKTLNSATRMTMTLDRKNGTWVIDNIRHDAAR